MVLVKSLPFIKIIMLEGEEVSIYEAVSRPTIGEYLCRAI